MLYNFVTPFLLPSVKITYCLEGKMVTLRALNKHVKISKV
jgi:hypothetical protein